MHDVDDLLRREQEALQRARNAPTDQMRLIYSNMAANYRAQMEERSARDKGKAGSNG
ncbi:hypothetical protein [Sphingomicrobium flavum]|uniref:hypothetical protein n=1 Tax=Sphingomicrobium flavum TaxID=1229164 RepID=UPI0021AE1B0B|nr:hypothetical protein [Sphingomicrobium flavum]